ncbi:hypothetical protein BOKEGFJH_00390 [Chlamydia avium]|uniref:Polymorphic outer membrane protein n=1 Tax=Chlamydia avium TaxID=1457141 RepID=A0ABN0MRF3_9CHLA|nr:hypothetical protein [Chlamydia avium]EPP37336.1 putative polymorphic outer membrane protein [Chlamydia psittaci 10_743_SC13]EPP38006.1 putative polymorphic outer membrane protein [Chlamydia avium]VVT42869.1 hypothetical protein BOKEGFJH_00390 [Chlamydia avium]
MSTALGFANLVENTLDSSISYNGNGTNSAFTSLTTSETNRTQYNCARNVCIIYAGTGKNSALSSSCSTENQGDLS